MDGDKSHSIGKIETHEPEDKSYTKHILRDGKGEVCPNMGSVCVVYLHQVVGEEQEVSEADMGGYCFDKDVEVTLGEGDTELSELFDKVVVTMLEGEQCYVKSKGSSSSGGSIPSLQSLSQSGPKQDQIDSKGGKVKEFDLKGDKGMKFKVDLKSFNRAADRESLEQDEQIELAQHHKDKGSALFQQGRTGFALKRYQRALDYVKDMEKKDELSPNFFEQHKTLKIQCYLNLAACYMRNENYEYVIHCTTKALTLDENNIKGLFRRGQAYTKTHKYGEAKTDLLHAQKEDPTNAAVNSQIRTVDDLIRKEKQLYKNMFQTAKS